MDLPRLRFGRGWDWLEDAQVAALAGVIARELAAEPDATTSSLAATVEAARETLSHYPDLDLIEACYRAGPEDDCRFCAGGSTRTPQHEVQEVPDWVHQARAERDAAVLTLSAIAETVALSDGQQESLGQWLAGLYHSDRGEFYKTFAVLRSDSSPQSAEAIAEAHKIVFGDQPPGDQQPAPTPLPGGSMSHTLAAGPSQRQHTLGHQRKHLAEVEGNRFARFGSGHAAGTISAGDHPRLPPPAPESPEPPEPPPAEPETERKPRRRRRRRR
jgi:hypothetical protein